MKRFLLVITLFVSVNSAFAVNMALPGFNHGRYEMAWYGEGYKKFINKLKKLDYINFVTFKINEPLSIDLPDIVIPEKGPEVFINFYTEEITSSIYSKELIRCDSWSTVTTMTYYIPKKFKDFLDEYKENIDFMNFSGYEVGCSTTDFEVVWTH